MISSTINKKTNIKLTYPCLKYVESKDGVMVVLFHKINQGTVIQSRENSVQRVGEYYRDWHESEFDIFEKSIVLENA